VKGDPRIWIINVHGPGGVGKSALVNCVVYDIYNSRDFEAIIHLTAKDKELTPMGISECSRSLYSLENLLDHIARTFEETPPEPLDQKKSLAQELLETWRTLLVLDNMETVQDDRILDFVQHISTKSESRVLLTSRRKTGGWENPIEVRELDQSETGEFIRIKGLELGISISDQQSMIKSIWKSSGVLPLAIQWILGQYKRTGNLEHALDAMSGKDSPVLEFTFGNTWNVLSSEAKEILAVLSIFDDPPTLQDLAVATTFRVERIQRALDELDCVTLISRNTQVSDNTARFQALPITLTFARRKLGGMGNFEVQCRQRVQQFSEQMSLREHEVRRFQSIFDTFELVSDNEKKAAILCQRGVSDAYSGNMENADMAFRRARELAPTCSYVYAISASHEINRGKVGNAEEYMKQACQFVNKKTGSFCYRIKAELAYKKYDKLGRVDALAKALEFDPDNVVIRHMYGVALSMIGRTKNAIEEFTRIIEREGRRVPPQEQLLFALKTRIINLLRDNRVEEARIDFDRAETLLAEYPHLAVHAREFEGFGKDLREECST